VRLLFKWYKLLRSKGYSFYVSVNGAFYNSKYWLPFGEWPYDMQKKSHDKSQHRLYTTKYEDLCQ